MYAREVLDVVAGVSAIASSPAGGIREDVFLGVRGVEKYKSLDECAAWFEDTNLEGSGFCERLVSARRGGSECTALITA